MATERQYVVDRIEGVVAVLVGDSGEEAAVPLADLRFAPAEGLVVRVPLDDAGNPEWGNAAPDEAATEKRRRHLKRVLRGLRGRDPGGDISL